MPENRSNRLIPLHRRVPLDPSRIAGVYLGRIISLWVVTGIVAMLVASCAPVTPSPTPAPTSLPTQTPTPRATATQTIETKPALDLSERLIASPILSI